MPFDSTSKLPALRSILPWKELDVVSDLTVTVFRANLV